jgi:hypothetical protein
VLFRSLQTEIWFVGIDYTTGPFKLGASYLSWSRFIGQFGGLSKVYSAV